jgi:hypothetical protein
MKKFWKMVATIIYIIGTLITFILFVVYLSHTKIVLNPNAMIPMYLYEEAFIWLAFGVIPMALACYAVYRSYGICECFNAKRNTFLIFIPSMICGCCAVFIIGIIVFGMFNSFVLN